MINWWTISSCFLAASNRSLIQRGDFFLIYWPFWKKEDIFHSEHIFSTRNPGIASESMKTAIFETNPINHESSDKCKMIWTKSWISWMKLLEKKKLKIMSWKTAAGFHLFLRSESIPLWSILNRDNFENETSMLKCALKFSKIIKF